MSEKELPLFFPPFLVLTEKYWPLCCPTLLNRAVGQHKGYLYIPGYIPGRILRAYPNNPAARKAIKPQAKWSNAR
jgi:hypothetical protein